MRSRNKYLYLKVFESHVAALELIGLNHAPNSTEGDSLTSFCDCAAVLFTVYLHCACAQICVWFGRTTKRWWCLHAVYICSCGQEFVSDPTDPIYYLSCSQLLLPARCRTWTTQLFTAGLNDYMKSWAGLDYFLSLGSALLFISNAGPWKCQAG